MRLYVTPSGRWAGTQSDAAKVAREADLGRWQQFEVPTDKPGLLTFLDERRVPGEVDEGCPVNDPGCDAPPDGFHHACEPPQIEAAQLSANMAFEAAQARSLTASEIVDFILDQATVGQVENIFQALGTRFAEARKG